jgi:hypothetical protein
MVSSLCLLYDTKVRRGWAAYKHKIIDLSKTNTPPKTIKTT